MVVGAGFAGLACADRLLDLGHQVDVMEARDRVGGRVWSQRLVAEDPATLVERGAEFVLDGYSALVDVAHRLGLSLVDTGMSYYVREPRGAVSTTPTAMAHAGRRLAAAARTAAPSTSLRDLADQVGGDAAATAACVARISLSCAYPPELLSARAALEASAEIEWKPSHRVAGGNHLVALGLAKRLGHRVHTEAVVSAIVTGTGQVGVATGDADVSADAVVVTVPASLTNTIAFDPPLPTWKLDALSRLGLGQAAKLHVPLAATAPTSAVLDVDRGYWCWTAHGADGGPQPVVHCFAGAKPRLDGLAVDDGPSAWVAALSQLRPDLRLTPQGAVLTTWNDDPWAAMAYSAFSTQQRPGDAAALARSIGPVHFAGEHTAGDWAALMEGALRSGIRAADEIHRKAATSG
ncbi:MAG TPA: NAD(P)/FAD-dependent oxidoreductase [Nocardioidaceae bacterium]|nr:NAD(P)/FAD-dependent oxidoreductase [Nocardioidaceae bacterium]